MTRLKFEYIGPQTIEEACALLKERAPNAKVMAGGTDLLVKLQHRQLKPTTIIGLKKIKGLDRIAFDKEKGLTVGATALLVDVASHPDVLRTYDAIAYAAQETGTVQIRNMGTVAGNICNAAPSADNAPTLLAMGATVTIFGSEGERCLPLDQFFRGPALTALESTEIVTSIFVPLPPAHSGASYQHISLRGKVDIPAVGVAAMVTMDGDICRDAKVALGAVAPIPMRAFEAEKIISGKKLTTELIEKAGIQASNEAEPISDVRATAEYRRKMVIILTKRALVAAQKKAFKGSV